MLLLLFFSGVCSDSDMAHDLTETESPEALCCLRTGADAWAWDMGLGSGAEPETSETLFIRLPRSRKHIWALFTLLSGNYYVKF